MARAVAFVALVLAFALPFTANAEPVIYFGEDFGLGESDPLEEWPNADAAEADFLSALFGVGIEDMESFEDDTPAPLPVTFPGAGITATLEGSGKVEVIPPGFTNGRGRYATSGTHYWETTDVFGLSFSDEVAAFGFHGIDIGDFDGNVLMTLLYDGGSTDVIIPHTVGSPGGTVIYFGMYDVEQQYTGVVFGNTAVGIDNFGFDDWTVGSIEQVLVGACCFDHECVLMTGEKCELAGGIYIGDGSPCDPNPCGPTATEPATWGSVKAIHR